MASPFRVLRKHQKGIIVFAGVILLVVWLLGDALSNLAIRAFGGSSAAQGDYQGDEVVVTYAGGEVTRAEVDRLVANRSLLTRFLGGAWQLGASRVEEQMRQPAIFQVVPFLSRDEEPGIRRKAVFSMIMAKAAQREGMTVGDDTVNRYLSEVCLNSVHTDELREMAAQMSVRNRAVHMKFFFKQLRAAILAYDFERSQLWSLANVLPEERYADWLKVNDQVELEVAAVPAAPFVVNVNDPTDSELQELFEKYRDAEPTIDVAFSTELPSRTPAFKVPRKVKLEYLSADFDYLVSELAEEVTDEEISTYYEANKDPEFVRPEIDVQPLEEPAAEPAADIPVEDRPAGSPPDDTPPDDTPPNDTSPNDTPPEDDPPEDAAPEDTPPEDTASGTEPDDAAPDGAAPTGAPPADNAPADKPNASDSAPTGGENAGAAVSRRSVMHLTAYQTAEASGDSAAEEARSDGEEAAVGEEPADSSDPAPEGQPEVAAAATEPSADGTTPDDAVPEEEPTEEKKPALYLPLDEVREEIRQRLAADRVPERQREIVTGIFSKLRVEFEKFDAKVIDLPEDQIGRVPPPNYELEKIAQEYGLTFEKTSEVSAFELSEIDPIGSSIILSSQQRLTQAVFAEGGLYKPIASIKPLGGIDPATGGFRVNEYVVIKVSDVPARVPEFAEVRSDVARLWKMQKASEMAFEEAKTVAADAKEAKRSLADLLSGKDEYEVNETVPFSQVELSVDGRSMHLGQPYGVDSAGPDFLRDVFEMEPDDVKALFNHDRSKAYVVRMIRRTKSEEQLHREFLADVDRWTGAEAFRQGRQIGMRRAFFQGLEEANGVEWLVNFDERERR